VVFQTDFGEIELLNIPVTSSQLRHQNNVTKIFHFGPPQSKFLATTVDKSNYNCNCNFILSVKGNCNYNCNWKHL